MVDSLPKISVITPSYNQGRFIERTIRSVLAQEYPALEYYVFDGGSSDESVAILRRYNGQLQWTSEKDQGQAHAINKGLEASSGEIIGWLNSDDIYYEGALAAVASQFRAHPEIDVVYGSANHIDEADRVLERYPTRQWNLNRLYETCFLCQPAVFLRRSVIERWGRVNETLHYCMDYEYWLRLARGGARFFHEPRVLAGSRLHPQTKTTATRVEVHKEVNDMLRSALGRTPLSWLLAYAHAVADELSGVPRSHRGRYRAVVTLVSIYASIRWNRNISLELLQWARSPGAFNRQWAKLSADANRV